MAANCECGAPAKVRSRGMCWACYKRWQRSDPDKKARADRARRALAADPEWRDANRTYQREYKRKRREDPAWLRAESDYKREFRHANPDYSARQRAATRRYYAANAESLREANSERASRLPSYAAGSRDWVRRREVLAGERAGRPYLPIEDDAIRSDLPLTEIAAILGRSYASVSARRNYLKKKETS